ncbi:polymer-forming cytoskeletal protein [Aurantibacter sp.]|uniref:bactofilin family protein n=1 Tax=Aurantibacter sp. TaxID=2807103 RepID=UPI0035C80FA4
MKRGQQDTSAIQNIIAKKTQITGDFISEGDIRIDGIIEGNVKTTGKVVVGAEGKIIGTLESSCAYFEGSFQGDMKIAGLLTLKSAAKIEGDVITEKLAVEPGATFNVSCKMTSSVKDLQSGGKTQKTA